MDDINQYSNNTEYGYGSPVDVINANEPLRFAFPPNIANLLNSMAQQRNPSQVIAAAVERPVNNEGEFDKRKFVKSARARLTLCKSVASRVLVNCKDQRFGRDKYIDLRDPNIEFIPDIFIGQEYPALLDDVLNRVTDDGFLNSIEYLAQQLHDAIVIRMNQSIGVFSSSKGNRYYIARWDRDTQRNTFVCMAERGFKEWLSNYFVPTPCKKKKNGDVIEKFSLYDIYVGHANKRQFLYTTFDPRWDYSYPPSIDPLVYNTWEGKDSTMCG